MQSPIFYSLRVSPKYYFQTYAFIIIIQSMTQQINQLCLIIAKNPSKINTVNEAITLASANKNVQDFHVILQLFQKLLSITSLKSFLSAKIQLIFQLLLAEIIEQQQQNPSALEILSECFKLEQKGENLVSIFLKQVDKKRQLCSYAWPSNLLIAVYEALSNNPSDKDSYQWQLIIRLIVDIPHFSLLNVLPEGEIKFKKSYQKLLIGVLGNENLPKANLYELYHNLGDKVLSKLSNPLILSNHCISRFALDPQIQIEVLSCLFLLVGKYGLQLQEFYPKLQTLITYRKKGYSIYELPNSKRFFRLLQAALRSSKVPFKTICGLTKIIISQIPSQKSQFSFWALSFIVNLTKKHRKLLDEIPALSDLKLLKYHYNPKIKILIQELSKNLNKVDYFQIQQFVDLDNEQLTRKKMQSMFDSLADQQIQFKLPMLYDQL